MTDYIEGENETDRMSDTQRLMTEAERDRIIKQISEEVEAIDPQWAIDELRRLNKLGFVSDSQCDRSIERLTNAQRVQSAQPSATSQAA